MHNRNPRYCDDEYEGYVVILNTLAKFFSDTRDDVRNYCDKIAEEARNGETEEYSRYFQTFLTFGDFDRISFKGINRFARFFDLDQRSKYWLGKHQNLFLYRIKTREDDARLYPYYDNEKQLSGKKDFGFCYREGDFYFYYSALTGTIVHSNYKYMIGTKQCLPYFLLTQISFSNEVITRVSNYSSFLRDVKTLIREKLDQKIRKEEHYRIFFDIYGCMNTSEIAILWLCSQYTEALDLMDYLKSMDFKTTDMGSPKNVFFSFYSIIGRTLEQTVKAEELFQDKISQSKGKAGIHLAISDSNSASEVFTLFNESKQNFENMKIIPGEHDIAMEIPSWKAYDLLCEEDIGSPNNGFFKDKENRQKILGLKVSLCGDKWDETKTKIPRQTVNLGRFVYDQPNRVKQFAQLETELIKRIDEDERKEKFKKRELDPGVLTLRELYQIIRNELKTRYNSHTGSVDSLDMLYTDYLSNIHETFNALWRNDYHYQFKKSLIYLLEKVMEETETENEQFWETFTETIENLRQQTEHFSQSGRLVMQIPASHLRYTASVDMLFHSYYGASKTILEKAYRNQTPLQYQSELLPIITTNITPMITSKLYKAGKKCDDLRILQIDIPYSLLFDPVTGFPFLVHELFHYITPSSRQMRNESIIEMAINEALSYSWYAQIQKGIGTYLFDLITKDTKKAREMGFVQIEEYDSPQSQAYYNDYLQYMASELSSTESKASRMSVLKSSIAHSMWSNSRIQNIRKQIVEVTINQQQSGQQEKIHPERQTWKEAIKIFWETASRLSIDSKSTISEQIAEEMRAIELLINDKKYNDINDKIINNMVIHSEGLPIEDNETSSGYHPSEIDIILYKHKYSLLNPYLLPPISIDKTVTDNVNDVFLKGLREAIPDYAMVKYCGMDDIEYLVTYARFTHDTQNSIIPNYDVLRLCFVLIWISDTRLYDINESHSFKEFAFENKHNQFVEQYVAEYMPHLSGTDNESDNIKDRNQEIILDLLAEAVWWFLEILNAVNKFKRDYDMYYDCILQLRDAYEIYFDKPDVEESEQFKALVDIVKEHRIIKRDIRRELISNAHWVLIHQITQYCIHYTYPDEISGFSKQWELREIKNIMRFNLKHPGIGEQEYISRMNQYDRDSFNKILEFVQVCERQITFETLGKEKLRT